jgi:hypothetical protein
MEKKLYLDVFLYYHLIVTIKEVFRKMPALVINSSDESRGDNFNFNNQALSGTAPAIAPIFYKVFKPLTAAWFT